MSNVHPTTYKAKLPYGLKVKPLRHYFTHGVIRFSIKEGKLFYESAYISKDNKGTIQRSEVKSKEHLQALMKVESIAEILRLTEVVI